jgi:hypothetical protein
MGDGKTKGGYVSGDTTVSELSVPEVLLRPGLGMATQEPQDTPPRVPILACPKCGESDTTMRWCDGGYSLRHGMCSGQDRNHFHRGCGRCGYSWISNDTLDSAGTEGGGNE